MRCGSDPPDPLAASLEQCRRQIEQRPAHRRRVLWSAGGKHHCRGRRRPGLRGTQVLPAANTFEELAAAAISCSVAPLATKPSMTARQLAGEHFDTFLIPLLAAAEVERHGTAAQGR